MKGRNQFTLVELLVVICIIAIVAGLILPGLLRSKSVAMSKACMSNMHQVQLALAVYCENNQNFYPVEATEENPCLTLLQALDADKNGLRKSFYCPDAQTLEPFAQATQYPPAGASTSIINTDANWEAGNISYHYWSFMMPKMVGGQPWFPMNKTAFWPRKLKGDGIIKSCCYTYPAANFDYDAQGNVILPYPDISPSKRWVLSDFFRQGVPYPHKYQHATCLTVAFLDGHADVVDGKPKDSYR